MDELKVELEKNLVKNEYDQYGDDNEQHLYFVYEY
jgi:hypothetical protein